MLTRLVRNQLIIFTIASVVGMAVMIFGYMQVPTLLGLGRITVTLELPSSGGLYRFSNVTYRGVQVGKVTDIAAIDAKRVQATLSLNSSPKIPADLMAQVRSISAVGEQYVDLQPRNESPPYLQNGSVIGLRDTAIPQQVGPMLDRLGSLVDSIPQDKLSALLDESFSAFDGAGYEFGSLLDSSAKVTRNLSGAVDQTRTLVEDSGPLLDSQAQSIDAIHTWARSLAGITDRLHRNDSQLRRLLQDGPPAADEVSRLLNDIKPTLPILLANLTTIGQVGVTYNPSLEQLLVLLPPFIAGIQAVTPMNNPTGLAQGDFAITLSDPPACTVGFLPPSAWRSPADTTDIDTPDGLYCKLPQDSPIAVRGARNYPCMDRPGKRAPTVQICDSDQPFEPLAQRQHALGPSPIDPNLIAQGIPPDNRVNPGENIYAPIEGTPLPPGARPASAPPESNPDANPPAPDQPATPLPGDPPMPTGGIQGSPAVPSSFESHDPTGRPAVAAADYNPATGAYMAADGHIYRQTDLVSTATPKAWTDLVLGPQ